MADQVTKADIVSDKDSARTGPLASAISQFEIPLSKLDISKTGKNIVAKLMDFEAHFNLQEIRVDSPLYLEYLKTLTTENNKNSFYSQLFLRHQTGKMGKAGEDLPVVPQTALKYAYDQKREANFAGIIDDIFSGIRTGAVYAIQESPILAQQEEYMKNFVLIGHVGINFNQESKNKFEIDSKQKQIREINLSQLKDTDIIKCISERGGIRKKILGLKRELAEKDLQLVNAGKLKTENEISKLESELRLVDLEIEISKKRKITLDPNIEKRRGEIDTKLDDLKLSLGKDTLKLENEKKDIQLEIHEQRLKSKAARTRFLDLTEDGRKQKKDLRREITLLKEEVEMLYDIITELANNPESELHEMLHLKFYEKTIAEYKKIFNRENIYSPQRTLERQRKIAEENTD